MTCNEFRALIGIGQTTSTASTMLAAARHVRECEACWQLSQNVRAVCEKIVPPERVAELTRIARELADKAMEQLKSDPELQEQHMPIVGRNKRAKPIHIWRAYHRRLHLLKPRLSETFLDYEARLEIGAKRQESETPDPFFRMLIREGLAMEQEDSAAKCTQREYLWRLEMIRGEMYKLEQALHAMWPNN